MLNDRVKCIVPNPATTLNVGSSVTLGTAPTGFRTFLAAFGSGAPAYFVLSDGNGKTITGVWTVNATTPETATITEIIWNDRTGNTAGETFSSACIAFNALPARETRLLRLGSQGSLPTTTGTGNAQAAAYAAPYRSLQTGLEVVFVPSVTNTGETTLAIDSLGTIALLSPSGAPCTGGELRTGVPARAIYNGTSWRIVSYSPSATGASLLAAPDAAAARTAIGAANVAGQVFTGAVTTSAGDITAEAGSLRSQLSGAATAGQVILGNGVARLYYNGTQFDLNAHLSVPMVRGGSGGDAGTLRTHGTTNSVNFRWDSSQLFYRVDESIDRAVMISPTNSTAVSQWRAMGNITPSGGTWAYFVIGFSAAGDPFSHAAGVAAGDLVVMTGAAAYTGFAWRIA